MVLTIIRSTINTKGLEELRVASQFSGQYLGSAIEYALIDILAKAPHLVKLGVRMEFRDSLNKCALALAKNLDRSEFYEFQAFALHCYDCRETDRGQNLLLAVGQDRQDWTKDCVRQEIDGRLCYVASNYVEHITIL